MKTTKDFRSKARSFHSEDLLRKSTKLEPIRKSGKERHVLYSTLGEDEEEDMELIALKKRESVLDYLDDSQEDGAE